MKIADVIEGGISGVSTVTLMQEALHKIDNNSPRPLFQKSRTLKKLKNFKGQKLGKKFFIRLSGELISNAAFFGLTGLGKKKNAITRGAILGALAGLGTLLVQNDSDENPFPADRKEIIKKQLTTIGLYTVGGLVAGAIIQKMGKKKKK